MNKKTVKPTYTVDLTNVNNAEEAKVAFALAKHNANIPLTDEELKDIISYTINLVPATCLCNVEVYELTEKKKPWYKRFWNKLKYAFTW